MHVTVRLYGNLRNHVESRRETNELDVPQGITIQALLDSYGIPENGWWMAAVNDQVVDPDTKLQDGDLLEVFDPVGGGDQAAPGARDSRCQQAIAGLP